MVNSFYFYSSNLTLVTIDHLTCFCFNTPTLARFLVGKVVFNPSNIKLGSEFHLNIGSGHTSAYLIYKNEFLFLLEKIFCYKNDDYSSSFVNINLRFLNDSERITCNPKALVTVNES